MKDTSIEMEQRFRSMILARSGEDRLKMGCSMHETAQALVIASLKEKTLNLTRKDLRRAIFLRFYGGDFDKDTSEKILAALANAG
jgi:hypothetical protein